MSSAGSVLPNRACGLRSLGRFFPTNFTRFATASADAAGPVRFPAPPLLECRLCARCHTLAGMEEA